MMTDDVVKQLDALADLKEEGLGEFGVCRQAAAIIRVLVKRLGRILAERELMDLLAEAQEIVERDDEPPTCRKCASAYVFSDHVTGFEYCPNCGLVGRVGGGDV